MIGKDHGVCAASGLALRPEGAIPFIYCAGRVAGVVDAPRAVNSPLPELRSMSNTASDLV